MAGKLTSPSNPTIPMADLGSKAVDSYVVRRKKKDIAQSTQSNVISVAKDNQSCTQNFRSSSAKDHEVPTKISSPKSISTSSPNPNPQSSTYPKDTSDLGVHSPKSSQNPSPARKLQQVFQQEIMRVATEERENKGSDSPVNFLENPTQIDSKGPEFKASASPTLRNARGDPYLVGDPNRGYSPEAILPRPPVTHSVLPPSLATTNLPYQTQGASLSQDQQASEPTQPKTYPDPNKGKPKNCASIFKSQGPALDVKLEYFPELHKGKNAEVEIDEDLTEVDSWDKYLVGYL